MSYDHLFRRYGSPSTEADIRISGYLLRPEKLTADRIARYDESAARIIAECESTIESMKEYRQALAARYATLETAPYSLRLELKREPGWRGRGIDYYVTLYKTYEDGTEVMELNEHYKGQQRREAIARFEEIKKQRPGIEAVKNIERKSWER